MIAHDGLCVVSFDAIIWIDRPIELHFINQGDDLLPEKKKEEIVAVGWYRWIHANVRNWYEKIYRKKLHEFGKDDQLIKKDGDIELTVKLLSVIPPTETEMYFFMEFIDVADERENYRTKKQKHYHSNTQIILFDDGKIMIPKLSFAFSKLEQISGAPTRSMSIADLADKNSFLNNAFYLLDRFFPQI